MALVARGGSNCQNSMLPAPSRRQDRGPNSSGVSVLIGSTQNPGPHRELLRTKSMAESYVSHLGPVAWNLVSGLSVFF